MITIFSIAPTTPDLQGIVSTWIIGSSAAWIDRRGSGNPKRGGIHGRCSWHIHDNQKITKEKGKEKGKNFKKTIEKWFGKIIEGELIDHEIWFYKKL